MTATAPATATAPQEQPAFINPAVPPANHTAYRKYFSVNQLMELILAVYPNIKTLAVLFDKMSQGRFHKINIKPLAAVVIKQDGTKEKLDYASLMTLTLGITDLTVPQAVFSRMALGEFSKTKLRRLDIEGATSVINTSEGPRNYHKSQLTAAPNQNILEGLQQERTTALAAFVPAEEAPADSIDDLF